MRAAGMLNCYAYIKYLLDFTDQSVKFEKSTADQLSYIWG